MSGIVTVGEVAAASGDAYGAYQGGLSTPSNQASFGAAVAAAAQLWPQRGDLALLPKDWVLALLPPPP